jgi:hypothetical protein
MRDGVKRTPPLTTLPLYDAIRRASNSFRGPGPDRVLTMRLTFSNCGYLGQVRLETGVGSVKGRVLTHQLPCVELDLFF